MRSPPQAFGTVHRRGGTRGCGLSFDGPRNGSGPAFRKLLSGVFVPLQNASLQTQLARGAFRAEKNRPSAGQV